MPEFKVGDKVKVVLSIRFDERNTTPGAEGRFSCYYVGDTGIVVGASGTLPGSRVRVNFPPNARHNERDQYSVAIEELELLNPHPVELMLS